MAACWHHAVASSKKFGGKPEDYIALHQWFDESKGHIPDFRHRALRHHSEGIKMAEKIFGPYILNSDGKQVPTTLLGEQHVKEDLGWIPTVHDWLSKLTFEPWMHKPQRIEKSLI